MAEKEKSNADQGIFIVIISIIGLIGGLFTFRQHIVLIFFIFLIITGIIVLTGKKWVDAGVYSFIIIGFIFILIFIGLIIGGFVGGLINHQTNEPLSQSIPQPTPTKSLGQLQEGDTANSISQAIDYTNPITRDFAVGLVKKTSSGSYNIDQICDIWEYCYNNWVYVNDPAGQDYYSPASRTINNGLRGDCDDFAILIAAVMQSIGGSSRVVSACNVEGSCHAYAEVFISTNWDKAQADAAYLRTRYPGTTSSYHTYPNSQGNTEYWLNLDWSANSPGGELFNDDGTYHVYYPNGFHETLTHTEPYSK